jgi:biopolymer transport protein TolR
MPTPLQKRKLMGEINVVPIEVDLPKAAAQPIQDAPNTPPLVLSVDKEGNLYINVGDDEDQPTSGEEVIRRVGIVLRTSPETQILVKADRAVPYGNVVGAMVVLQQGGAESIGFVTDPLDTYPIPE